MSAFEEARCIGQHWLFDSTDPEIHKQAAELCADCPALLACRDLLIDVQANISPAMRAAGGGATGTWAGVPVGTGEPKWSWCGNDGGYYRHRRNDEDPCGECWEAHSKAESKRYQIRRAREAS